jgi:PST family polysaccharide transporter/lipopolysaccharide exporter
MAGGLLVLSREFVHLFLTDKWLLMAPLIQLMCLQAMLTCVGTPGAIIFQASGRPAIGTKITVLGVLLLALFIYPFSARWGINGAVMALLLSVVLVSPVTWQIANRIAGVSLKEFAGVIVTSLVGTGLMCGAVHLLKNCFSGEISLVQFCVLVMCGMVVYFGLSFVIDRYLGGGSLRDLLRRYLVRAGGSGSSGDNVL